MICGREMPSLLLLVLLLLPPLPLPFSVLSRLPTKSSSPYSHTKFKNSAVGSSISTKYFIKLTTRLSIPKIIFAFSRLVTMYSVFVSESMYSTDSFVKLSRIPTEIPPILMHANSDTIFYFFLLLFVFTKY
ncbi:hypothetical protein AYI70_g2830 [Smittium culicis]|uniref:Uncharacterized protein n=1 Tax=Smittium culicis TaxID=133412 RepID=A0A1R1Y6E8_9FUNG|nr:hypothetical protein AYI70_g2830 [Smittium culicis]